MRTPQKNLKSECRHPRSRRSRAGFTLIEAALTTVIVGTGVLAIVAAQQAYHMKNDWAQRTGTAQHLANELRELTLRLPMHDPISGDSNLGPESNETQPTTQEEGRAVVALGESGTLNWDDLDDFAGNVDSSGYGSGTIFNPPISAMRRQIPDMENWRQVIEVEGVWSDRLNDSAELVPALDASEPSSGEYSLFYRLTVTVEYRDPSEQPLKYRPITSLTWVVPE